jgi:hypothetical protein
VRWFPALVIAVIACDRTTPPARVAKDATPPPITPIVIAEAPLNTTGLGVEPVESPISDASVRFLAPSTGQRLVLAEARNFDVRWQSAGLDPDALGVDIALDAYRPRRLPPTQSAVSLAVLVPADEELTPGEHWLFAAPITASGLVPRRSKSAPGSAVALEFIVGDAPLNPAATGAIWLRKPEGTYNGPNAEHVLFDAQAFDASGAPLGVPCAIHLQGPAFGDLALPAPFSVLSLKNGDYELRATARGSTMARSITVNSELGRLK